MCREPESDDSYTDRAPCQMVRTSHGIWHPRPQNEDSYADGAPAEQEIEEQINLDKFNKFMIQMKKYEEVKERMKQEEEDRQKIHVKL